MKSMTGFGRGSSPLGGGRIEVEIRALNHRFLEVRTRVPRALGDLATEVERLVRARLRRGRIEVQVSLEGATGWRAKLDRDLAREAFKALSELRDELTPGEPIPLGVLAAAPDLFVPARGGHEDAVPEALRRAFTEAADRLDQMRATEGGVLCKDIGARLAAVGKLTAKVRVRVPKVVGEQQARLRERVERLLKDGPALDEARLEQEVALLAERTDVSEELTRVDSHCDQLERLLSADGEAGRRMEFLLQELGREVNTIGAKSPDAEIAHLVVDLKVEIERMREQSQNVE